MCHEIIIPLLIPPSPQSFKNPKTNPRQWAKKYVPPKGEKQKQNEWWARSGL